ncbi:hypothetical protein [Marinimicrobium locisalis]|uniref:hypothetical protein n=1 Tax=Marinimicrobium locisalis TaxID=546022 RepID=UPI0032214240
MPLGKGVALLCIAWMVLAGQYAWASDYSGHGASVKLHRVSSSVDVMTLAPPNASGLSINRFDRFETDDRPLSVLNPMGDNVGPVPATIVIIADSVVLNNTVEVGEAAADIVFVVPRASGSIRCNGCELKNFHRITFVVNDGSYNPSAGSAQLGAFRASANGLVALNGLRAPGAITLDVLAGRINTSGTLDLHQKAVKNSSGSYDAAETGNYTIGTAAARFMTGKHRWDYDTQKILDYDTTASVSTLRGTVKAVSVKWSLAAPASFAVAADTRTSLLSSVRYRNQQVISNERIAITHYAGGTLSVRANQTTQGQLGIKSVGGLTLASGRHFQGQLFEAIAGGRLTQRSKVSAVTAEFSGARFINEGNILGSGSVKVWGEHLLANRYGGRILADVIQLETDTERANSYIINGSRTPYYSEHTKPLPINGDFYDELDEKKLGVYYTAGVHKEANLAAKPVPASRTAHIRGRNIKIKTNAFENINPYYEILEEEGPLTLQRALLNQVSTVAEHSLHINAGRYIVNSSAHLGAEGSDASVNFSTGVLLNERYRVLSILDLQHDSYVEIHNGGDEKEQVNSEIMKSRAATYAPPGVLFSMNDFAAHTDEFFLNSMAYVEIFGNASFRTDSFGRGNWGFIDAGMAHMGAVKSLSQVKYYGYHCIRSVAERPESMTEQRAKELYCKSSDTKEMVTDPQQMDSLFYINGNSRVYHTDDDMDSKELSEAYSLFTDYSPFEGYVDDVVDELMQDYEKYTTNFYTDKGFTGGSETRRAGVSNEVDLERGTIDISYWERIEYDMSGSVPDNTTRNSGTDSFSIFEEIKALYERLKEAFMSFVDEVKWWD